MKRLLKLLTIPASIALTLCLTGCPSSTAVHKASAASAGIGSGLSQFATLNHQLIQENLVSVQEGARLASLIDRAALANDAFVKTLQGLPDTGSPVTATAVLSAFSTLQTQILNLQQEGVLGLKSADAQAKFGAVMATIQGGISAAEVVIAANTPTPATASPDPTPAPPATAAPAPQSRNEKHGNGGAPLAPLGLPTLVFAGLILSPSELEELISLALAAGSALVVKLESLRGQTDAELQNSALGSDAAAEQQAQQDEGTGTGS